MGFALNVREVKKTKTMLFLASKGLKLILKLKPFAKKFAPLIPLKAKSTFSYTFQGINCSPALMNRKSITSRERPNN